VRNFVLRYQIHRRNQDFRSEGTNDNGRGLLFRDHLLIGHECIMNRSSRLAIPGIGHNHLEGPFHISHSNPAFGIDLLNREIHRFETITSKGRIERSWHTDHDRLSTEPALGLHKDGTTDKQKHQNHQ
jgi:hypothetical protein